MSHSSHGVFPHPVLSPRRRDYRPECEFKLVVPEPILNARGEINIPVEFLIDCPSLGRLVEDERATCVCLVECASTYQRRAFSVRGFQDILGLHHADLPDSFRITPYIAATQTINGFCVEEFSEVAKVLLPKGIDLQSGAVLAIGDAVEIEVKDPGTSIFNLGVDSSLPPGIFSTDLSGERIAINVHRDDLRRVHQLRRQNGLALMGQALFLHSVGEALRGLVDHGSNKRWATVLRRTVREVKGEMADEDIAEYSERIAQEIFQGKSFSGFLDAMLPEIQDE
ncbi:MAG: hypothetical protein F4Y80_05765 [Caldilineaceae bacterium SB0665_bin_21]|nr:hypothetical protein [Caldilineaceae bacterium SB0665_bin_21]